MERPETRAALVVAILVLTAASVGLFAGAITRPTASPAVSPRSGPPAVVATPSPTVAASDPADAERRALAQPLVTGCATSSAVWVLADGGTAIRFDGSRWTIPDATLRSPLAAACRPNELLAVGRNGTLLRIDDARREMRLDRFGVADLAAVALVADGAIAVGDSGAVVLQSGTGWREFGSPLIASDLRGVSAAFQRVVRPGQPQAWAVGAGGSSYRFIETAWEPMPTGTTFTLRGVVMQGDAALAVGDRGTVVRFTGGAWRPVASGVDADLRAIALVGAGTAWVVGSVGTVIEISGDGVRRVDLGTTCTLRSVFAQDAAVWIVGSDGTRGAIWRVAPSGTTKWGTCP